MVTVHCARLAAALCVRNNLVSRRALVLQCRQQGQDLLVVIAVAVARLDVRGQLAPGREDLFAEVGVPRALSHHDGYARVP